MADTKISALPAASAVAPTDVIPFVQSGTTKKMDASLLGITARTSAEISAGVTPASTGWIYPVGDVRRYGAVGNGSTDDTTALQSAINVASWARVPVYLPAGRYRITAKLWLQYHVSSNPGFMTEEWQQARIKIVGDGCMDYYAYSQTYYYGSVIEADAGVTNIFYATDSNDSNNYLRNVEIRDLTLIANAADFVVYLVGINTTDFRNLYVVQKNNGGGGFYTPDGYLLCAERVTVQSSTALSTSIGWHLWNQDQAGGLFTLRNISITGFKGTGGTGYRLGKNSTAGSVQSITGIKMISCEANNNDIGIEIGYGVRSCDLDGWHSESNASAGIWLRNLPTQVGIRGYFADAATNGQVVVGDDTLASFARDTAQVWIHDSYFTAISTTGINVKFIGASASGITIERCQFVAASNGVGTGIALPAAAGVTKRAFRIHAALFPTSGNLLANDITNSTGIEQWIRDGETSFGRLASFTQADVASATNITYVNTGNIWRVTGTTTINTITAPTTGTNPVLFLWFTGNLTVNDQSTSAGNIHLYNNANFVTGAGAATTLTLLWDSTNTRWLEVARSVN